MIKQLKKHRLLFGLLFLAGLIEMIALGIVLGSPAKLAAKAVQATSTPAPTSLDPGIQALQAELNRSTLSNFAREGVEEKISMAQRLATAQAIGASQPRDEKIAPTLAPAPVELLLAQLPQEGIFEGSEGIISPSVAQITNVWQGTFHGYVWQVFAGSPADRSDLGILMIFQEDPVMGKRTFEVIQAPGTPGKLRIVEVQDNLITLQTIDDNPLVFDLETKKFQE